ncbi:MAG: tetratricopeptide repeat protein [Piscinibacter sp.]|nr:tetratricopeptide repeat protein [Piscinibacter sp.]
MRPRQARALRADLDRGLALHRQQQLEAAAAVYRGILKSAPDHPDALQLLGAIEGQQGRYDSAIALLRRAVAAAPDSAVAHNNLGNALASAQRHAEALPCFERALRLKPDNPKALRNRGNALRKLNRLPEALECIDRVLALQPGSLEATVDRGELMVSLGRHEEAIACFRAALAGGKDLETLRYVLASLGAGEAPEQAPPDYVKGLFDQYAATFDHHLVDVLGYHTPDQLLSVLRPLLPATPVDIVDLGCGTGLFGALLRPLARRLVGVDLSDGMLERARAAGHYDELACAELVAWLDGTAERFHVAAACDVLNYLGALDTLFGAVRRVLQPDGLFAFSVEAGEDDGFQLRATRRYAHSRTYLERCAAAHKFSVTSVQQAVLRKDANLPVPGLIVVLRTLPA